MKLLICSPEYYPHGSGIANVARNVVEQLKKKGIDCIVCSPTGPDITLGGRKAILKFGRFGLLYFWLKVHFFFKRKTGYDAVWLHQPLFILKNPFPYSITTIHITSSGHFRATEELNYPFYLRSYYFISALIEYFCLKQVHNNTKFVVDSPQVGTELSNIMSFDISYKYISNGVDIKQFKPLTNKRNLRNQLNIPLDKIVFIAVGRLSYPKRLFTMVDVFSKLQKKLNNSVLIICGNGELGDKLKSYIRDKDIKNVEFKGLIPHNELHLFYGCADYYITTSGYEGQPLTLLEAMACGLPCIVSNIPNLSIVADANCGLIVDFSNISSATNKILDYLKKDNLNHGINARKYAEKNLDWETISNNYLNLFNKIRNDI